MIHSGRSPRSTAHRCVLFRAKEAAMCRISNPLVLALLPALLAIAAGPAAAIDYLIEVQIAGPGTVTPPGPVFVSAGGSQTFTFAPSAGNVVGEVTVDDVPVGTGLTEYTFTNVQSDHLLYVPFGPPPPPPPPQFPGALFSVPFPFDTWPDPYDVAIADLNADGRPDLVTANWNTSTVSVLLGNTFGVHTE